MGQGEGVESGGQAEHLRAAAPEGVPPIGYFRGEVAGTMRCA